MRKNSVEKITCRFSSDRKTKKNTHLGCLRLVASFVAFDVVVFVARRTFVFRVV